MSNQVDFLPFASGAGANVLSQSDYAALAAILTGFQSGTAKSAQVNKALRQGTVMAAVLANFIASNANVNVLDNGDTDTLLTNFVAALKAANASAGFLNKSNNLSDVLSAATALANLGGLAKSSNLSDLASIPTALANLGLGDGSTLPVGTPIPWPTSTAPTGWLKCNGATFTAAQYPKLALAYPGLVLPDLRGEFIRGWDDGRGVDAGRTVGSTQSSGVPNITGYVLGAVEESGSSASGAFTLKKQLTNGANGGSQSWGFDFDASRSSTVYQDGLTEARPRNVAFNYIVRAA